MIATNLLADSVDGEHGRVKTEPAKPFPELVGGKHGRVKTKSLRFSSSQSYSWLTGNTVELKQLRLQVPELCDIG